MKLNKLPVGIKMLDNFWSTNTFTKPHHGLMFFRHWCFFQTKTSSPNTLFKHSFWTLSLGLSRGLIFCIGTFFTCSFTTLLMCKLGLHHWRSKYFWTQATAIFGFQINPADPHAIKNTNLTKGQVQLTKVMGVS